MSKDAPMCKRCERHHWLFRSCEEAKAIENAKPTPDLYADWSERDTFQPYEKRGLQNRNYGGRMTVLPAKEKE